MSLKVFDDNCPGCKPVILDKDTLKPFPADSPPMVAINRVWAKTTLEEREAFHKFTCLNSRAPSVMGLVLPLIQRMEDELKKL